MSQNALYHGFRLVRRGVYCFNSISRAGAIASCLTLAIAPLHVEAEQTAGTQPPERTYKVDRVIDIGRTVSSFPVGFDLLTHDQHQFVAYYNGERKLVVAARKLGENQWRQTKLPETVPWDSHNYVTIAIDGNDQIHLAANMHLDPLNYYRTSQPLDIQTFEQLNRMTGEDEHQCTYPMFLRDNQGRLLFMYRDGASGDGRRLINLYDAETQQWRRWVDRSLLDGQGEMNAYPNGPEKGPDGMFHLAWVWRNTPDADTNHDLCYMRSRDLKHWFTASGEPLELPVTPSNKKVIVDPVPPKQGLLNSAFDLGFDGQNRPILSYHKYDESGDSQIYNARWENDRWQIYQTSDFAFRWEFGGYGALPGPTTKARGVRALPDGRLVQ
jgi:hypothetical protein